MAKVARLLDQIIPERYVLNIDVDMEGFRFSGNEKLAFNLVQPARELIFHTTGLEVSDAKLTGGAEAAGVTLNPDDQTVTIAFDEELAAGAHELDLKFAGILGDNLHGFYRSGYKHNGAQRWIATTQFEAVHAREGFVCIDEPAAKAVFEVSLTVPSELTAVANTDVLKEESAGARKKVTFTPTPKMSTYLVAYVVGDFERVERATPEGVMVGVLATPGQTEQLEFALETAVRTLSFYNEYFGIPYPLPKLDMLALPDFAAAAMENWGLVTYRETALLFDAAQTSLSSKQRVVEVVAHELAHQWFGNLVTMAWWSDLWLNEGFATWVASLAMDKLFPEWEIWTSFIQEEFSQALEMDSLANTHPIQVEVDDPRSLDEIFDAISYAKGASVINMLHHYLGAEDFRSGLHSYLEAHAYGNSVTYDLWTALGKASGKPVDEVMSAWTSQPGYPLIGFDDGQVTQTRFYSSPREAKKAGASQLWPVPFSVVLAGGDETEPKLIEAASENLPLELMNSDWFKPNPGQTSVFRVMYTSPMIAALTPPLEAKTLVPTDRYGLVDDVMATTESGHTSSSVALKLMAALRNEPNYVVWNAVGGGLGSLIGITEDDELRSRLEGFGGWLIEPNVKRLGWERQDGETAFDTLMRPVVLQQAVRFDNEAVTAEAKRRFDQYLAGGEVDPDLRGVILFAAARHGRVKEFEAILELYRKETVPQVKISLLGALGRFRKPELIARYLEFALTPEVRAGDIFIVLAWSLRNRDGRDQAWQWLQDNWELWLKRYGAGGHMLERFPLYAASGFATHKMAKEIGEFFAGHPHPALKRPSAQAVEAVELKADWAERDQTDVASFLDTWEATTKTGA
jgi:aminopeptidase N